MRIVPIGRAGGAMLDPDLLWNGLYGDLALTEAPFAGGWHDDWERMWEDESVDNPLSLTARHPLQTAVLICLMTDIRVEPSELPDGEANRGWPGDGFDRAPDEPQLGSRLWLLRRRALTPGLATEAEDHARAALQTLIDQGVAVRCDVTATARPEANRLDLAVALAGRDGRARYQQRFAVLWDGL